MRRIGLGLVTVVVTAMLALLGTVWPGAVEPAAASSGPQVSPIVTGLSSPNGMVTDEAGDLFVADSGDNSIMVLPAVSGTLFGQQVTAGDLVGLTAASGLSNPTALAFDGAGDLYIANNGDADVVVVPASTTTLFGQSVTADEASVLSDATSSMGLVNPQGIAIDSSGNLYVSDYSNAAVYVLSSTDQTIFGQSVNADVLTQLSAASGLGAPSPIAFDAEGDLYIGDQGWDTIYVVPADDTAPGTTLFGQSVSPDTITQLYAVSGLQTPAGLALDTSGDLYVTDFNGGATYVLPAADGTILGQQVSAGSFTELDSAPGLGEPSGLALDSAGDLDVADYESGNVYELSGGSGGSSGSGAVRPASIPSPVIDSSYPCKANPDPSPFSSYYYNYAGESTVDEYDAGRYTCGNDPLANNWDLSGIKGEISNPDVTFSGINADAGQWVAAALTIRFHGYGYVQMGWIEGLVPFTSAAPTSPLTNKGSCVTPVNPAKAEGIKDVKVPEEFIKIVGPGMPQKLCDEGPMPVDAGIQITYNSSSGCWQLSSSPNGVLDNECDANLGHYGEADAGLELLSVLPNCVTVPNVTFGGASSIDQLDVQWPGQAWQRWQDQSSSFPVGTDRYDESGYSDPQTVMATTTQWSDFYAAVEPPTEGCKAPPLPDDDNDELPPSQPEPEDDCIELALPPGEPPIELPPGELSAPDDCIEEPAPDAPGPFPLPPAIVDPPLASGYAGVPYSASIAGSNGAPPYAWSFYSGTLPPGLNLDPTSGVISGTPSATDDGTYDFTAEATDASTDYATEPFSITVYPPPTVTTQSIPPGEVGVGYSAVFLGAVGVPGSDLSWSFAGGSLPPGCTPSSFIWEGELSCTPTGSGSYTFSVTLHDLIGGETPAGTVTQTYTLSIYPPIGVSTTSVPQGAVGQAYPTTTLQASGGSGTYTWRVVSGSLPPGLSLSSAGVISGTPAEDATDGPYPFTVEADDNVGGSARQALSINPLHIVSTSLPGGEVGQSYPPTTLQAAGGQAPDAWYLLTGAFPPGLSLSANGVITGTPTATGPYCFTLEVADSGGDSETREFCVDSLRLLTASLPAAETGRTYNTTLQATGGDGTDTWSITEGALPAGLALSSSTGVISGTLATTGLFAVEIEVSDGSGDAASASFQLEVYRGIGIATTSLTSGYVGANYSVQLGAVEGFGAYTWSVGSGALPPGLEIAPATGIVSGVPTAAGTFSFSVLVSDSAGYSATAPLSIVVDPAPPPLVITTSTLPSGAIGSTYVTALAASGGAGTETWSVTSGALPAGLTVETLNGTGEITGVPTAAGTYTFTVQVADDYNLVNNGYDGNEDYNQVTSRSLSMTVVASSGSPTISGFDEPGAPAFNSAGDLFVPDSGTSSVTVLPTVSGTVFGQSVTAGDPVTLAAATGLSDPACVAFDSAGDLFIGNFVTRNGGVVSGAVVVVPAASGTIFGQPVTADKAVTLPFGAWPWGLAFDAAGDLFIANATNSTVTVLPAASGTIFGQTVTADKAVTLTAATGLSAPLGLAFDGAGDLFIANTGDQKVTVLPVASGTIFGQTVVADKAATLTAATGLSNPEGIAFDGAGDMFVANYGDITSSGTLDSSVTVVPATTGTVFGQPVNADQAVALPGYPAPTGLAFDASGNLFISLDGINAIYVLVKAPLGVSSATLPAATTGAVYSASLETTGGVPDFSWSLASGSSPLPPGLSLESNGTVVGTPTTPGTFTFTVQVTDFLGKVATAQLSIAVASDPPPSTPLITASFASTSVISGANVTFTASVTSATVASVAWELSPNDGGTWYVIGNADPTTTTSGTTTTSTITFPAQSYESGYEYQAVFTNTAGPATTPVATLTVTPAVTITGSFASTTVTAGANVTFTASAASATGLPAPSVAWELSPNDGGTWYVIGNADPTTTTSGPTTTSTITFPAQSYESGYEYQAVFTNSAGPATTPTATLTVNG